MQRHAFWVTLAKFLDVFAVFALSMLLVSIFPDLVDLLAYSYGFRASS